MTITRTNTYFANQAYPLLGKFAITLQPNETNVIKLDTKFLGTSRAIVTLAIFLNVVQEETNLTFDILRDDTSIINGPRLFISEPLFESGEFGVPWYTLDKHVPRGKHVYSLVLKNNAQKSILIDNYSFIVNNLGNGTKASASQLYPSDGKIITTLNPGESKTIELKIKNNEVLNNVELFLATQVQLVEDNGLLFFDILRNSTSLLQGEKELVDETGTFPVNWTTLDTTGTDNKDVVYSAIFTNRGQGAINIYYYSFIGQFKTKCNTIFSSNEKYRKIPTTIEGNTVKSFKVSVAPKKFKLSPNKRGQVFMAINFALTIFEQGANLLYDVVRDDGHSITNGRQFLIIDNSTAGGNFEINTVIADLDAPSSTRSYSVKVVNIKPSPVDIRYYSITAESV